MTTLGTLDITQGTLGITQIKIQCNKLTVSDKRNRVYQSRGVHLTPGQETPISVIESQKMGKIQGGGHWLTSF